SKIIPYFSGKIVDYKLFIEKKAQAFQSAIFDKDTELFNSEVFNKENIEWVFLTIDSHSRSVNYQLSLVPMLDLVAIKENNKNPTKVQKVYLSESENAEAKAVSDFAKGEQVYDNLGLSNDLYLLYHGFVLENNSHDCYSLQATFSE